MMAIIGFILLALGVLEVINPRAAWKWEVGWKIKDAEPSDTYLLFARISGIITCIVGLVFIIFW